MFRITEKRMLNDSVCLMSVMAPAIAEKAQPGQFIIFRIDEEGERIPLTIADYDRKTGEVTIIFQLVGYTTIKLASLSEGDSIADFVGPLGRPSEFFGAGHVAVVGGGVGCAIAYPQAKYLHAQGVNVDLIAGFRSKDIVILEDEMKAAATRLLLTTDDGSYIRKGFVTEVLQEQIESGEKYDLVIAIGPVPMMRAVSELTRQYGIHTVVSLNPIMIDGTGMCGCCRVTVDGKTKFACVDGPDFDGHLVDFAELQRRNAAYKAQEAKARDHACNLFRGVK